MINEVRALILRIQTTSVIIYAGINIQQALVLPRNGNSHRNENIFHGTESRDRKEERCLCTGINLMIL